MNRSEKHKVIFMKNLIKDSLEYDKGIQAIARRLSNGDNFLAEELRSEMHIAILSMEEGQDKSYYFRAAKNKAIDYIRSKARNYSYGANFKHISLEAMTESGFQIDSEGNFYAPESYSTADMGIFEDS